MVLILCRNRKEILNIDFTTERKKNVWSIYMVYIHVDQKPWNKYWLPITADLIGNRCKKYIRAYMLKASHVILLRKCKRGLLFSLVLKNLIKSCKWMAKFDLCENQINSKQLFDGSSPSQCIYDVFTILNSPLTEHHLLSTHII